MLALQYLLPTDCLYLKVIIKAALCNEKGDLVDDQVAPSLQRIRHNKSTTTS